MLFNSVEFIFWFVPITLAGFFVFGRWRMDRWAIGWLIVASLFFYAWWRIEYLPILVGSIVFNYFIGRRLAERQSRWVLAAGVGVNLAVLGYFKYTIFLLDNVNLIFGTSYTMTAFLLPLGISFFTFQQIAFLVDSYDKVTIERNFLNYGLFVSFFPQLIAGPIVHHKEMLPQFQEPDTFRPKLENITLGLTIFAIGLFKKVVIADRIAFFSTRIFDAAEAGAALTFFEAWGGALAFTFQLYFDFSGYSDMAIGLGLLFGIRLPINFNSPFKAASIIEFWQRWHITLTRFLTAYLYNPLVMNLTRRRMAAGKPLLRRGSVGAGPFVILLAVPTLFTMFMAGIWHGAGYQFVVFGLLHGVYLVVNHGWRTLRGTVKAATPTAARLLRPVGVALTFAAVVFSLVFFRADSVPHAMTIVEGMAGLNGAPVPAQFARYLGAVQAYVPAFIEFRWLDYINTRQVASLVMLLFVVWFFPNTLDWVNGTIAQAEFGGRFGALRSRLAGVFLKWSPNPVYAVLIGFLACLGVLDIVSAAPSEFLYFNF